MDEMGKWLLEGRENKTMKSCPICGNEMKEIEVLYGKLNTTNVVEVYRNTVNRTDLTVYKCPVCEHGAIGNFLDDEFYADFSVALEGTDEATVNQRSKQFEPIIDLISEYAPDTNSLFEIGSGCGYLCKAAKKKFGHVLGVEPSKVEYDIATRIAPGCDFLNDYFGSNLGLIEKYSAFVATMVFEHIPDVGEAISYAYRLLKDGGVGFITVPNGQRAFQGGAYYDIYPQHLHYFSFPSLAKLASNAGFEIIFIRESSTKDYLEMLLKRKDSLYEDKFTERLYFDKDCFRKLAESYKNVSVWGASYAARSCIEFFKPDSIKHIYDVSGVKIGKYIPGFPLRIERPEANNVNTNDLIIIMANEYTRDVLSTLEKFEYKGEIVGFDSDGRITKLTI